MRFAVEENACRELKRHLWVLAVILLALCAVGRKMQFWPIMTWPVYGTRTTAFPAREASYVELHVVTGGGERVRVSPPDIYPMGRRKIVEDAIGYAFSNDDPGSRLANRSWLRAVIQDLLAGRDLDRIEAWNLTWDVEPLAIPPLKRNQPAKQIFLGAFALETLEDRESTGP